MLNICFLDEYAVVGADLTPLHGLGNYRGYDDTLPQQVVERCRDSDVVITNKVLITKDIMERLPRLKLVCIAATGMNNIDLEGAEELGVAVLNAVGYSTYSVTEATFAGVLSLLRQSVYYDRYVKSGEYGRSGRIFHYGRPIEDIHGKRWGIIGMGNIGRQVASVAAAFGAQVVHYSASGRTGDGTYPQLTLEELLKTSDIVSIHAPLTGRTRNLIGFEQLSLMKPSAVIANMARGGIVNEEDLARALNEERIAGAVLDVYSREPMTEDNPLHKVADPYKLLLSSHTAWRSREALARLVGCVAENIRDHFGL